MLPWDSTDISAEPGGIWVGAGASFLQGKNPHAHTPGPYWADPLHCVLWSWGTGRIDCIDEALCRVAEHPCLFCCEGIEHVAECRLEVPGRCVGDLAAKPGTGVSFEIGASLVRGWTFKTVVQGSSVPQVFIPRLIQLWKDGHFSFEKLVGDYKPEEINEGFEDSGNGKTIKSVLVF